MFLDDVESVSHAALLELALPPQLLLVHLLLLALLLRRCSPGSLQLAASASPAPAAAATPTPAPLPDYGGGVEAAWRPRRDVLEDEVALRRARQRAHEVEEVLERVARLEAAPHLLLTDVDADLRRARRALGRLLGDAQQEGGACHLVVRLVLHLREREGLLELLRLLRRAVRGGAAELLERLGPGRV